MNQYFLQKINGEAFSEEKDSIIIDKTAIKKIKFSINDSYTDDEKEEIFTKCLNLSSCIKKISIFNEVKGS